VRPTPTVREGARHVTAGALLVGALAAGGPAACGDAAGRRDSARAAADAAADAAARTASVPPSGTPMEHMDMARAMSDTGRAMRGDLCAVGPASAADAGAGDAGRRVALVLDAAGASRPTRVAVTVAATERDGLTAEWVVDGRTRAACSGDDLMIAGAGAPGASARLDLTSRGPVTVVARTADARVLAGPVRVGPGAPDAVLAWGGTP
jgi:hypothetical protein